MISDPSKFAGWAMGEKRVLEMDDFAHLKSQRSKERGAAIATAVTTQLREIDKDREQREDHASLRRQIIIDLGLAISRLHALTGSLAEVQFVTSNAILEVQKRTLCRSD